MQLLDVLDTKAPGPSTSQLSDLDKELKRMLSIRTIVSTSSSGAPKQATAQAREGRPFKKIGAGACGAVFAQDGKSLAMKLAKSTDSDLWNDYLMHRLSFEKYCAPLIKPQAFADPANKDCLERVYLGSPEAKSRGMFFSLRNFKLHLKQMVELQLNVEAMTSQMAETLAVMHWAARTDARDVEFVLGSSTMKLPLAAKSYSELVEMEPCSFTGPESRTHEDFFHRKTELWLLDFNQFVISQWMKRVWLKLWRPRALFPQPIPRRRGRTKAMGSIC
ncbi:hypothetical protein M434DRAFT_398426 [Hypoxylon sp. CO27-5]|nr:hypothetical protein M434DRAFT_398426 [Hypoxylon sp. CO27-5]